MDARRDCSGGAGAVGGLLCDQSKQHWTITRPGLRRKRWEKVWEVLQILRLMVSELRPEGWDNALEQYVGGRHPDELVEEARHWMKMFPKLTVKDRKMVPFPQDIGRLWTGRERD